MARAIICDVTMVATDTTGSVRELAGHVGNVLLIMFNDLNGLQSVMSGRLARALQTSEHIESAT